MDTFLNLNVGGSLSLQNLCRLDQAFGIEHGAEMCRKLLAGGVPGLHMYSLNLEATVFGILERVGFIEIAKVPKALPWKHIPIGTRRQVSVQGESTSAWCLPLPCIIP